MWRASGIRLSEALGLEERMGNSYLYAGPCVGRVSSARTVGGCPVAMAVSTPAGRSVQSTASPEMLPRGNAEPRLPGSARQQSQKDSGLTCSTVDADGRPNFACCSCCKTLAFHKQSRASAGSPDRVEVGKLLKCAGTAEKVQEGIGLHHEQVVSHRALLLAAGALRACRKRHGIGPQRERGTAAAAAQ